MATSHDDDRERRPDPDEGEEEDGETGRDDGGRPAALGRPHHRGAEQRRHRVARPRRGHAAGAAHRATGHGVAGHVTAEHETRELPPDEHPDHGVTELVHEGDGEAYDLPQRLDGNEDERDAEDDQQPGGGQGDVTGRRDHPVAHRLEPVHGRRT